MKYRDEWYAAVLQRLLRLIAVDGLSFAEAERWIRDHNFLVGGRYHYVPKTLRAPRFDWQAELGRLAAGQRQLGLT